MLKIFSAISRVLLISGILVTLAPCYACEMPQEAKGHCSMASMAHPMDCCKQSKPMNPLCKAMGQSTVNLLMVHPPMGTVSVALLKEFVPSFVLVSKSVQVVALVESPPKKFPCPKNLNHPF